MAMTYQGVSATVNSASFAIKADGTSGEITVPLTGAPFSLPFTSTSFPSQAIGTSPLGFPGAFGGTDNYTTVYSLNSTNLTLTLTFTATGGSPVVPPVENGTVAVSVTFVYLGS